jgi:hypothetical protein
MYVYILFSITITRIKGKWPEVCYILADHIRPSLVAGIPPIPNEIH